MKPWGKNYFYTDAPSPLHDALEGFTAHNNHMVYRANALAESVGATGPVAKHCVVGFVFGKSPPDGWKCLGITDDGEEYFSPPKRSKEQKAIHKAMRATKFENASDYLTQTCRLNWMTWCSDGCMRKTVCGWKRGRIFVVVPTGGDGNHGQELAIPAYLKPCREWEMKRWFDEPGNDNARAA